MHHRRIPLLLLALLPLSFPSGCSAVTASRQPAGYVSSRATDAATLASPATETAADGDAPAYVEGVDGQTARFFASEPGWFLRLFRGRKPLAFNPGHHELAVRSLASDDGSVTASGGDGSAITTYLHTASTVLKVELAPHGVYRLAVTHNESIFTFTLWDESQGRDKRTVVASKTVYGKTQTTHHSFSSPSTERPSPTGDYGYGP